jgi:hypothetical protein
VGREQHGVRSCAVGFVLMGLVLMSDTKTMRDTRTRVHAPHTYCRRMYECTHMPCTCTRTCLCLHIRRAYTHVLVWCSVRCMCTHKLTCDSHSAFTQGLPVHYSQCVYTYARIHMQNSARVCISMHAYAHSQNIHMHNHMHMHTSSGATRHGSRLSSRAQPETEPTLASFPDAAPRCTLISTQSAAAPPLPKHTWREPGVSFVFWSEEGSGNSGELVHHWLFWEASGLTQDVAMV